MPGRPLVVFDGDDTLWFVEPLYDAARARAAEVVAAAGVDPVRWDGRQRAVDLANVATYGMSKVRFPASCVAAYVQCADEQGVPVDLAVVDAVERAAASVFDADAPLAEGAHEVLSNLARAADLALLTKGDRDVQATRIVASGLAHLFGDVVIVPEKSPATFRHVVERMGAEAASSWSVGNSLASDVHPALAAGMRAVWVDAYVWPHERRERTPAGDVLTASSLREAGRLVTAAHPVPAPAGRGGGRATLAAALPGDR